MGKTKILFVCASLKVGGAEKSLVNLLNLVDYSIYDVDLLLLQKQGAFLAQVPKEVTVLDLKPKAKALYDEVPISLNALCLRGVKYSATAWETVRWKEYDVLRAHRWKNVYSKICEPLDGEYDVVVAFQSGESTYFAFDKVKAKRKITYFHTDISNITLDVAIEHRYLGMADLIVTISNKCVESINTKFPEYKNKTICLENLSSAKLIKDLAGDEQPKEYEGCGEAIKIVSVGRLIYLKGYDMAIDAAKILQETGIQFQWFIVGEGNERPNLEAQISKHGLESSFHLIGLRSNPYPYMKFADIPVQSSRYEGKSVVLDEAKILGIPIVVTNYNSVNDQIKDGGVGLIAEMSAEGISEMIQQTIKSNFATNRKLKHVTSDDESAQQYMKELIGS